MLNDHDLCLVCKGSSTKYCCPKCFIPYCSLNCYRSHSNECSEAFYKDRISEVIGLESRCKSDINEMGLYEDKLSTLAARLLESNMDTSVLERKDRELVLSLLKLSLEQDIGSTLSVPKPWWLSSSETTALLTPSGVTTLLMPEKNASRNSLTSIMESNCTKSLTGDATHLQSVFSQLESENGSDLSINRTINTSFDEYLGNIQIIKIHLLEHCNRTFKTSPPPLSSLEMLSNSSFSEIHSQSIYPNPDIMYHVLGVLLGYVTIMRSTALQPLDDLPGNLDVLAASCPALLPTYRPSSARFAIEAWIAMRPPTVTRKGRSNVMF